MSEPLAIRTDPMPKDASIFLAGHRGMVGSAIRRRLEADAYRSLLLRTRAELDLSEQTAVRAFFANERPDYVILAAAKVGGIAANNQLPAEFIYENLMIEANVVDAAWRNGVRRLLLLGSSCIYPKMAAQPMEESALLGGPLEPTNEPYAVAKIAGVKLCESYNRQYGTDFRSVMPSNLYGPNDNFHPEHSHVVPALIRKIHEAKQAGAPSVTVWGSGRPLREFLHVDDMAAASLYVMNLSRESWQGMTRPMLSHINVGSGKEVSIGELARTVCRVVGYEGELVFDSSKPDGTPRKLMDSSLLARLGWTPAHDLDSGLVSTYRWFLEHQAEI